jgi:hypothetical protein
MNRIRTFQTTSYSTYPCPAAGCAMVHLRISKLLVTISAAVIVSLLWPSSIYGFWIPIHDDLTFRALTNMRVKTSCEKTLDFDTSATAEYAIRAGKSDIDPGAIPRYHCDNEQLSECSLVIQRTYEVALRSALAKKIDYAWDFLGYALHALQDFYAHSNWVEMGLGQPYPGLADGAVLPAPPASSPFCDASGHTLLVSGVQPLTTGYYTGCTPPPGKCVHGNILSDINPIACTGISKDKSTSPGYGIAVNLAYQDTQALLLRFFKQLQDAALDKRSGNVLTCLMLGYSQPECDKMFPDPVGKWQGDFATQLGSGGFLINLSREGDSLTGTGFGNACNADGCCAFEGTVQATVNCERITFGFAAGSGCGEAAGAAFAGTISDENEMGGIAAGGTWRATRIP